MAEKSQPEGYLKGGSLRLSSSYNLGCKNNHGKNHEMSIKYQWNTIKCLSGWCFGTCLYMFLWLSRNSWEWNVIIPTDELSIIFQRGRAQPPTSNWGELTLTNINPYNWGWTKRWTNPSKTIGWSTTLIEFGNDQWAANWGKLGGMIPSGNLA